MHVYNAFWTFFALLSFLIPPSPEEPLLPNSSLSHSHVTFRLCISFVLSWWPTEFNLGFDCMSMS